MLSAHHCFRLCLATCFDHRMWASSGNCQKNNIWTAGKSKILKFLIFTEKWKGSESCSRAN